MDHAWFCGLLFVCLSVLEALSIHVHPGLGYTRYALINENKRYLEILMLEWRICRMTCHSCESLVLMYCILPVQRYSCHLNHMPVISLYTLDVQAFVYSIHSLVIVRKLLLAFLNPNLHHKGPCLQASHWCDPQTSQVLALLAPSSLRTM